MEVQKKTALPSFSLPAYDDRTRGVKLNKKCFAIPTLDAICILTQPAYPFKPGQVTAND